MIVSANPLPALPQVPNGRGRLQVDIPYTGPVLVDTKLGCIPKDFHFDDETIKDPYVSCANGACTMDGQDVVRPQPVYNADGSAKMAPTHESIDESSRSVAGGAAKWGAICGVAAAAVGAAAGLITGGPVGALASLLGGIGATVGGLKGGLVAASDHIRLEWKETPVEDLKLAGYSHTAEEQTYTTYIYTGKVAVPITHSDGYDHSFEPDVQGHQVGTYMKPVVVHYSA